MNLYIGSRLQWIKKCKRKCSLQVGAHFNPTFQQFRESFWCKEICTFRQVFLVTGLVVSGTQCNIISYRRNVTLYSNVSIDQMSGHETNLPVGRKQHAHHHHHYIAWCNCMTKLYFRNGRCLQVIERAFLWWTSRESRTVWYRYVRSKWLVRIERRKSSKERELLND